MRPAPRNKSTSQGSLGPGPEVAAEMGDALGHAHRRDGSEGGSSVGIGGMRHPGQPRVRVCILLQPVLDPSGPRRGCSVMCFTKDCLLLLQLGT